MKQVRPRIEVDHGKRRVWERERAAQMFDWDELYRLALKYRHIIENETWEGPEYDAMQRELFGDNPPLPTVIA